MKKGLTEMVFILDRSGSMAGMAEDVKGGFNGLIEKQRAEEGEAIVTTVLFDDRYEVLHDRVPLPGVPAMTGKEYYPRGCTALLDAVGNTINKLAHAQQNTAEDYRPEHTIFTIITDGMENASREYTGAQVRGMITERKNAGWEFVFLGANIDAATSAAEIGIERDDAVDFHADSVGMRHTMEAVERRHRMVRGYEPCSPHWREDVDADYASRRRR